MRTETRTVRIGEKVGPVDWSYNFRQHFDCMGTSDAGKDEECERKKRWLKYIENAISEHRPVRVTNYGGWPRCAIYSVIDIGMYDGWPYWKPVPSVLVVTSMGQEWYSFSSITDVYPSDDDNWKTLATLERAR
jgi:hypothetical protein